MMSVERQRARRPRQSRQPELGFALGPVETAFTAELTEVSIDEVFQTLARAGKDAIATIEHGDQLSCVWCQAGQPIDAHSPPLGGLEAFYRILSLETGSVRVVFRPSPRPRRIELPLEALRLGHAKLRDESVKGAEQRRPSAPPPVAAVAHESPQTSSAGTDSGYRDLPEKVTPPVMSRPPIIRSELRPTRRAQAPLPVGPQSGDEPESVSPKASPTSSPSSSDASAKWAGPEPVASEGESVRVQPAASSPHVPSPYPLAVGELIEEEPRGPSAAWEEGLAGLELGKPSVRLQPWQLGAAVAVAAAAGAWLVWWWRASPEVRSTPPTAAMAPHSSAPGSAAGTEQGSAQGPAGAESGASATGALHGGPSAAGVAEGAAADPGTAAAERYTVDVEVEPESAVVRLDGTPVAVGEVSLQLPVDGRSHYLRISAEGFRTQTLELKGASVRKRVRLEPEAPGVARSKAAKRWRARRTSRAAAPSPTQAATPAKPAPPSTDPPSTDPPAGAGAPEATAAAGPPTPEAESQAPPNKAVSVPATKPQPKVRIIE